MTRPTVSALTAQCQAPVLLRYKSIMDIDALQGRLRDFSSERDWEQFHTPKNLVMALAGAERSASSWRSSSG